MADSKAHPHLFVTPPNQISKDVPVSDSSIPFSPQWLHSKPGECKVGMTPEGNHSSPYSGSKNEDSGRSAGDGEKVSDPPKKKDVYRPTFLETDSARRDRWRDEERDTNVSVRQDRWREGDKDLGDTRNMDRWANNSPAKNFGEGRRVPSERWIDPSKEAAFDQRRENKWNTRWGPDDKETDKWSDFGKHGDASPERGLSHLNHGKDEREADHVRPWRPTSTLGRRRTDPLHHQLHITSKEGHSFGHEHARGDNVPPSYSRGRDRLDSDINSNAKIPTLGQSHYKADNGHGKPSLCRYDRTKLLDLYSVINMRLLPNLLDGFSQVPSLTQEEPVEPLALSALTTEELAIFRGIDKGDIISSGAPQKSKDGSVGQGSSDSVQTRRPRLGSRDGVSFPDDGSNNNVDDSIDPYSSLSVGSFHDKQTATKVFRDGSPGTIDDMARKRDPDFQSNALPHSSTAWKSSVEHAYPSGHGWFDPPTAVQSKSSEISWSEAQKERSSFAKSSYPQNELKWQTGEDQTIRRQQFVPGDRELEARKLLQPSPEDLILYYKDPQGQLQGPFSGIDIIGWFEAGYFGIDLLVRLANAPPDSPFSLLGDMMPHLRAKARPPPGFSASKPNEMPYLSTRPVLTGPSGIDMIRNEHKPAHGPTNEAEKRFLESLMSGSVSSSPLDRFSTYEGSQGYTGHDSISQPKDLSGITDMPHQPSHPQNMDMMSVLQGLSDSSTVRVNNGASGWSVFPVQGGMDPLKDKIELHQNQNLPPQAFGLPQQRVQPQNHPSIAHLLSQTVDNPSTIANPENLFSSSLAQDPQILNVLHQQQLLQMQPQSSLTLQQLSLLDKFLLIKQKQKQEEQLRVQQQQLLSQVLTEHHQRLGEPPYGQLHPAVTAAVPVGSSVEITAESTPVDHLRQMIPQQILQVGPQVPASTLAENGIAKFADTPHHVSQQTSYTVGSETSVHLPHQTSGDHRQSWATMPAQDGEIRPKDSSITAAFAEGLSKPEAPESCFQVDSASKDGFIGSESLEISHAKLPEMTSGNETSVLEQENVSTGLPSTEPGIKDNQSSNVTSVIEDVKHVEVREVRKTSEKKSRKQKSSKAQTSSEQVKGIAKSSLQQSKQAQTGVTSDNKSDVPVIAGLMDNSRETVDTKKTVDTSEVREVKSSEYVDKQNTLENSAHRGWKPTLNVKPKSLLEIQQEEERKVKTEVAVSAISSSVSSLSLSAPWAGVISSSEQKMFRDNFEGVSNSEINVSKTENSLAKKSQLHDLLAAEVLAKSSEQETLVGAGSSLPSFPLPSTQADAVDDDFIEAKDTKKGRKKAGKTKAAGSRSSTSVPSVDAVVSFIETGKSSRKVQQEKEVLLPAPSVGPSLGDFVPWKGEATSPSPAPAWSTDSGKLPKPTSLRDILYEEERRGVPTQQQLTAPRKSQAMQVSHTSSRSSSATLPTKASAPMSSQAPPQTKYKGDDDLFWGPPEQSKQEIKSRSDFPQLGNSATPVKPTPGASLTSQKSAGRKGVEILSPPNSAQSSLKVKRGGDSKRSEAMEFCSWCESESVRLTGSKDTSFLEYCLKQSRSEAEILLTQNLGGLDPNHKFINKFLDYMDMLPADVLVIAFQGQNDHKATAYSARDMTSDNTAFGDSNTTTSGLDGSAKGGKKKGKKGKKVSPAVLGFNVVSNRIMMGEIQTVDD